MLMCVCQGQRNDSATERQRRSDDDDDAGMAMIMLRKIMMTMSAVAKARAPKQSVTPTHVQQTVEWSNRDGETSANHIRFRFGNQLALAHFPPFSLSPPLCPLNFPLLFRGLVAGNSATVWETRA